MKFTKRTYRIARKRASKREYQAFSDNYISLRGPDPWIKAMNFTNALIKRKIREGK